MRTRLGSASRKSPHSSEFSSCPTPFSTITFWVVVRPPTPTSPPSSSAFEPALRLEPSPSRFMWVWWVGLHALLGASAMLVAVPTVVRFAVLIAILGHGVFRRPRPPPTVVLVGADGRCVVPEWGANPSALGPQTLICSGWLRLDVRTGSRRRDILLFADQLPAPQWTRLRARLRPTRRG